MAEQTFGSISFFLKVSIYPKSDAKDPPKLLKFEKNPYFNIKYLPNGREYLNSATTGESGVKNWIRLNYFRFLGPIAEWEKKVGSMDLVHLNGGLLVKLAYDYPFGELKSLLGYLNLLQKQSLLSWLKYVYIGF
jgi:hypothetical protein